MVRWRVLHWQSRHLFQKQELMLVLLYEAQMGILVLEVLLMKYQMEKFIQRYLRRVQQ